ncbi:hypothetical protein Tco_0218315 [Tanacetum coccineum]
MSQVLRELVHVVVSGAKIPYWGMQKLKLDNKDLPSSRVRMLFEARESNAEKEKEVKNSRMNLFKIVPLAERVLGIRSTANSQTTGEELDNQRNIVLIFERKQVISAAADEVPTGDAVNIASTEVNTASAPVTTVDVFVSTAEPITTVSVNITTVEPITLPTTATTVFEDEYRTIAQTLVKMRSEKLKVRGVVMQEPSETATRPTVPSQQKKTCPNDKGKGKIDSFVPMDFEVVKGSKERLEQKAVRLEQKEVLREQEKIFNKSLPRSKRWMMIKRQKNLNNALRLFQMMEMIGRIVGIKRFLSAVEVTVAVNAAEKVNAAAYKVVLLDQTVKSSNILRVLRIIFVIFPEHQSDTQSIHSDDGNRSQTRPHQLALRGSVKISRKALQGRLFDSFQDKEKCEHVGPIVTRSQEGIRLQDDEKRLCLVNDIKKAQDHIQVKLKEQAQA